MWKELRGQWEELINLPVEQQHLEKGRRCRECVVFEEYKGWCLVGSSRLGLG